MGTVVSVWQEEGRQGSSGPTTTPAQEGSSSSTSSSPFPSFRAEPGSDLGQERPHASTTNQQLPKSDHDRRSVLVTRLASILYLEKLRQGGRLDRPSCEKEDEQRKLMKALLLQIARDEGDEEDTLYGPKGTPFSPDARRLLQTFLLEAVGILVEQSEGLALEAWQTARQLAVQKETEVLLSSQGSSAEEYDGESDTEQSRENGDHFPEGDEEALEKVVNEEIGVDISSSSGTVPSPKAVPAPSPGPVTTTLPSGSAPHSGFLSSSPPLSSSQPALNRSMPVTLSPRFSIAAAKGTTVKASSPYPPPIDNQAKIAWHHVVKGVELLLQFPLGREFASGAEPDPQPDSGGDAVQLPGMQDGDGRRQKARSLSALGRNNLEDDQLLRHYAYFRLIDENVPAFLRLLEPSHEWQFVTTKQGVTIHKKPANTPQGRNIHCIRGVGIIEATPWIVKDYLFEQKEWTRWDCYAKDYTEVERLDRDTKVTHFMYETERCFMQHRRDFCALMHLIRRPDGSIVLFGQSVEHPRCPIKEGWRRGLALHSGALIEPRKNERGKIVSKVTMITQIDLAGLPATIVNAVQVLRPLLLANVQRCIQEEAQREAS